MSLFTQLELREGNLEALSRSQTGVQVYTYTFGTFGAGELVLPKAVVFDAPYAKRPYVTTGSSLTSGALVAGAYPHFSVGVAAWVTSADGLYIGASLFAHVDQGDATYALTHHFTFTGQVSRRALAQIAEGLQ